MKSTCRWCQKLIQRNTSKDEPWHHEDDSTILCGDGEFPVEPTPKTYMECLIALLAVLAFPNAVDKDSAIGLVKSYLDDPKQVFTTKELASIAISLDTGEIQRILATVNASDLIHPVW